MSYKDFKIYKSEVLPDVTIIEPEISWDKRGNIYSSFNRDLLLAYLPEGLEFLHDKFAESKHNVLRGLHGDNKTWKLVSCVWGEIWEVVADMRETSPTFKKWEGFRLSSKEFRQVLIPPGFVNGYYISSENAVFHYKLAYTGDYIDAAGQITIKWNDPDLGITWPCTNPILQDRDK